MLVFKAVKETSKENATAEDSCKVEFKPPPNKEVTYVSGYSPLTVSWPKFEVKTDCESSKVALSIKTEWSDDRFSQDADWITFSATTVDNSNEKSYFILSSFEITGEPFHA